jgi:hypothetical protein
MIGPIDTGCVLLPDLASGSARPACILSMPEPPRPVLEIIGRGEDVIAKYHVAGGNNNGNGNIGNGNGNFNSGSNNGNYNIGDNNGNCFASDNNGNKQWQSAPWDYRALMEQLKRCHALRKRIPQ